MINSIMDTRVRQEWTLSYQLKLPKDEYEMIYDGNYSNENAEDILKYYLEMRGDEGKAKNIIIKQSEKPNMIEIQAELEYFQNEHTDYKNRPNYLL